MKDIEIELMVMPDQDEFGELRALLNHGVGNETAAVDPTQHRVQFDFSAGQPDKMLVRSDNGDAKVVHKPERLDGNGRHELPSWPIDHTFSTALEAVNAEGFDTANISTRSMTKYTLLSSGVTVSLRENWGWPAHSVDVPLLAVEYEIETDDPDKIDSINRSLRNAIAHHGLAGRIVEPDVWPTRIQQAQEDTFGEIPTYQHTPEAAAEAEERVNEFMQAMGVDLVPAQP